jgi:hypothetical protein
VKAAFLLVMALSLVGCGTLRGDYDLPPGDANYDALKAATEACKAKGGEVRLKGGYDNRELSNYQCKIGKAG